DFTISAQSPSAISLGYDRPYQIPSSVFSIGNESCPRCGAYSFSLDEINSGVISLSSIYNAGTFSDLYKCKSCNLELTKKEYEIAKKLKK
ncbi:MAG: hypothetical protein UU01_C0031G0014, partial [Parcubacteria group bacterium GW2011_GWA2_40_37]